MKEIGILNEIGELVTSNENGYNDSQIMDLIADFIKAQ